MKLKLDENLGPACVLALRELGHDVSSVHEQQLSSADDRRVIDVCSAEERCLVTLDLDFSNPLVFQPERYHGIAVYRIPGRITLKALIDCSRTLGRGLMSGDIRHRLWIIESGRIREYSPER